MVAPNPTRHGENWTRDELVLALDLYHRPGIRRDKSDPHVQSLASAIGRTSNSVAMKLSNFASKDPSVAGKALDHTARLDGQILRYFAGKPEVLREEAAAIRDRMNETGPLGGPEVDEEVHRIRGGSYRVEDGEATVKVRRGQAAFARIVRANYQSTCGVCAIDFPDLLVASHIKPWADDPDHRLDPSNGLCLCALHDRLFDRGLITLSSNLDVVVSRDLREAPGEKTRDIVGVLKGARLRPPIADPPNGDMLDYHRRKIFRGR